MGDLTNADRIANAQRAIDAHVELFSNESEPLEDRMTDLLTDLRHLAISNGIDFENLVWRSEYHTRAEIEEEDET